MIMLKSLLVSEAFVPDKAEFEKELARSEHKVISVLMDKSGKVYIDDPVSYKSPIENEQTKARLRLNYNNNEVDIYKDKLHGNKIDAAAQQMISALLKVGVIDSSWKVSFSDDEGYYLHGKYSMRKGEYEGLPPNFWKRNTRVDLGENLIFYHGTSDLELPTIKKYGLRPLGMEHTAGGHETRLRVEDNKNTLYLTGTFVDAFRYAQIKARSNMLRVDKTQYQWVEHWEWERWFIKPVVLSVRIPDFTRLRSDDDRVIRIIKDKADKLWDSMSEEQKQVEKELSVKWFKEHGINYEPYQIESYLWTISQNGFEKALKLIDKNEWKDWKASLGSHNQVGYQGVIPPQYLRVIDLMNVTYKK